jgi:PIN domain nuclease of toxin-antitoxin system
MRLLLDTHAFLWWCANDPQLSTAASSAIADAANEVFVSAVNGWEIAIKARLGKLPLPDKPASFMTDMLKRHAFAVLPITMSHAVAEHDLPAHHSDPFDRLLISQAKLEGLTLVTNDPQLQKYGLNTLW